VLSAITERLAIPICIGGILEFEDGALATWISEEDFNLEIPVNLKHVIEMFLFFSAVDNKELWNSFLPSSRRYSPGALASSTTSLHCSLSFVFSINCVIFITFKSAATSCIFPGINIVLTFQVAIIKSDFQASFVVICFIYFSSFWGWLLGFGTNYFYGIGLSHAQPPTWRTRVSLFIWVITRDLFGMGCSNTSIRYCQRSSGVYMTTQAPPLRKSRDTLGVINIIQANNILFWGYIFL